MLRYFKFVGSCGIQACSNPTFEDRASLPYVEAFSEKHGQLVFPQGVAHTTVAEDVYDGFYLPKGNFPS